MNKKSTNRDAAIPLHVIERLRLCTVLTKIPLQRSPLYFSRLIHKTVTNHLLYISLSITIIYIYSIFFVKLFIIHK